MSEESKAVLVLSPITDTKWVQEAYEVTAGCGHQCWLSPGSQENFLDENIRSMCIPCIGGDKEIVGAILAGKGRPANKSEVVRELKRILGLP